VVITGDLTEDGVDCQFEMLAEALLEAPFAPSQITLVAGNHDAYDDGKAFSRALQGPLAPFAKTSTPGVAVDLGSVLLMPLSTSFHQPIVRASGFLGAEQIEKARSLARRVCRKKQVVFALHHAPIDPPWSCNWLEGLLDKRCFRSVFEQFANTYSLSGHTHRAATHPIGHGARVFVAPGVVDCANPVRLFEPLDHGFCALESHEGRALPLARWPAKQSMRA
jgi:3',5'-cyclic AMP phosphodiesterase CpdA